MHCPDVVEHAVQPVHEEHVVVFPPVEYVNVPHTIQSPFEYLYPASHPLHFPVVTIQLDVSHTVGHDTQLPVPSVEY